MTPLPLISSYLTRYPHLSIHGPYFYPQVRNSVIVDKMNLSSQKKYT